jgi:hypothetical protein
MAKGKKRHKISTGFEPLQFPAQATFTLFAGDEQIKLFSVCCACSGPGRYTLRSRVGDLPAQAAHQSFCFALSPYQSHARLPLEFSGDLLDLCFGMRPGVSGSRLEIG